VRCEVALDHRHRSAEVRTITVDDVHRLKPGRHFGRAWSGTTVQAGLAGHERPASGWGGCGGGMGSGKKVTGEAVYMNIGGILLG